MERGEKGQKENNKHTKKRELEKKLRRPRTSRVILLSLYKTIPYLLLLSYCGYTLCVNSYSNMNTAVLDYAHIIV